MLHKIGTFNSLVDLLVLNEGYFHVPISVLAPIKDDFMDVIRYKDDEIEKNYKLDFSDTKYDFLNELEPQPNIDIRFTKGKRKKKGSYHVIDSFKMEKNNAFIQIDFSTDSPERILSDVIEHEVSHFFQQLIKKYNIEKKGYGSLGGLPRKRILRSIEKSGKKPTTHSTIPKEMYPDLLSAFRELDTMYKNQNQFSTKKEFFLNFLKMVKNKKPIGKTAYDVFSDIEDYSKELYRDFVKKTYIAFVND
jgi:hypothetical protein